MDSEPLGLILVENGTKGDRLLFRFPFMGGTQRSSVSGKHASFFFCVIFFFKLQNILSKPVLILICLLRF